MAPHPCRRHWVREPRLQHFPMLRFAQGYGLTETAPLLTMLDHQSHVDALEQGNTSPVILMRPRTGRCGIKDRG